MIHHVLAIDLPQVGAVLRAAGINDVVFAENVPARWMFDEHTHTWTVAAADGEALATRVVLSAGPRPPGCGNSGRPYAGVALPGLPNFFLVPDDSPARMRYVADCLTLMASRGCTRMEVRYSSQRVFHEHIERGGAVRWRHLRKRIESAFDLCAPSAVDADIYDGVADIDGNRRVRVRLAGHLDPIDGRYHWQGTVFDKPPDEAGKQSVVRLTIGGHSAPARITELTPWGSYSVAGIGAPPFALDDAVLSVPQL